MFQLRQKLRDATQQYLDGNTAPDEYLRSVTLALADARHTTEVAGWVCDMIRDKVDGDEAAETK